MRNLRWKILVCAAVLILGLPNSARAAVDPGDYVVGETRIEGNKLISTDEILDVMKTHSGDKFSRDAVMEDLKAINEMGYFDERKLEVNPALVDGKARLIIKVEENPVLKSFSVRGNSVVDSAELLEPFAEQVGKPQNANRLSEAVSKVESKYHDRGYVLAKVKDVVDSPDGSVELIVDEGIIDSMEISGVPESIRCLIAPSLSFVSGSVYNEKLLTKELRLLHSKGKFEDLSRSLVPSDTNKDRYVLKIGFRSRSPGKRLKIAHPQEAICHFRPYLDDNFKGKGVVLKLASMTGVTPVAVPKFEVEELYEDPRYGFELVRYESTSQPFFKQDRDNGRKLVWRKMRSNQFLVNCTDYHKRLINESRQRRRILQKPLPTEFYLGRAQVYKDALGSDQDKSTAGPVLRSILLAPSNSNRLIVK